MTMDRYLMTAYDVHRCVWRSWEYKWWLMFRFHTGDYATITSSGCSKWKLISGIINHGTLQTCQLHMPSILQLWYHCLLTPDYWRNICSIDLYDMRTQFLFYIVSLWISTGRFYHSRFLTGKVNITLASSPIKQTCSLWVNRRQWIRTQNISTTRQKACEYPLGNTLSDKFRNSMIMSSNGNIFRVTGPLSAEFTDHRWIPLQRPVTGEFPLTNASDAEFWCFLCLNKR